MGEIFALCCALVWAMAVILLKRSGEKTGPFALNLFRVSFSMPLLVITLLIVRGTLYFPAPPTHYLILIASGIIGIAAADTLFHMSLNRIGASLTAIVESFYPLITAGLALVIINERLQLIDLFGMAMVMSGILFSSRMDPMAGRTRRELLQGFAFGLGHITLLSIGIVMIKPVLRDAPVLWATSVRQLAALVVLHAYAFCSPKRRLYWRSLRPSKSWKFLVPAAFLGSYLALLLWIASMKYTLVGISAILTQSTMIFILIFAAIFLNEPLTRRKIISALLAFGGVILVTLV